jgi:hypothetical protein
MTMTTTDSAKELAMWQHEPCPLWCDTRHDGDDRDEDRDCIGGEVRVPMTLAPAVEFSGDPHSTWEPATLHVYLRKSYLGGETVVHMFNDDVTLMQFDPRLPETAALARLLTQVIETASADEGSAGGAR